MKTKYERLNKEEKKYLNKEYINKKKDLSKKIKRMLLLCIVGIVYGLFVFIYDVIIKNSKINIILDLFVFVVSLYGYIKVYKTKKELLNKYLLEKEKVKKKEVLSKIKKSR